MSLLLFCNCTVPTERINKALFDNVNEGFTESIGDKSGCACAATNRQLSAKQGARRAEGRSQGIDPSAGDAVGVVGVGECNHSDACKSGPVIETVDDITPIDGITTNNNNNIVGNTKSDSTNSNQANARNPYARTNQMTFIEGGEFSMGSDKPALVADGEGPARLVTINAFYLDIHETSNAEFEHFVDVTGYITEASSAFF